MAITPREAIGSKLEIEQQAIESFEKRIDDALRKSYDGRGGVSIDPSGVSGFVREEVVKRFEKAGWDVKYTSDQRDGDFLTFKSK